MESVQGLDAYRLNPKQQHVIHERNWANEILFGGAKGGGKLGCLTEHIVTPAGWTTFGEVNIGDHVFGENGSPTQVIALSEIVTNEDAYRFTFSDGTSVVTGERHLWKTMNAKERAASLRRDPEWMARRRANRKSRATGRNLRPHVASANAKREYKCLPIPRGAIRTTQEIHKSLYVKMGVITANHSIANHAPLKLADAILPIPPYTLGAWLGDGTARCSGITGIDPEIFGQIEADGFTVTHHANRKSHNIAGFTRLIKTAGLLGNKHIPTAYLRASYDQRLALLHGLMDTDGWCERDGSCKISLSRKALFEGVVELIRTFGITVNVTHCFKSASNGAPGNKTETWTATFTSTIPVFRLARKSERQNRTPNVRYSRRFIVASENIGKRSMRCIQVAASDGMFLCGRSMVPTHNSFLFRYIFSLLCLNCPGINLFLFRRTFDDLWKNHMEGPTGFPMMLAPYVAEKKCAIVKSEVRWANGARIFLNHLQLSKHVSKYQGQEMHSLGLDEATQFEQSQIQYLYGSVRLGEWGQRRAEILANGTHLSPLVRGLIARLPLILLGANPGGVSHHFIKERFIDQGAFKITESKAKGERAFRRQFIPARAEDNPNLLKNDPEYLDRLDAMGDEALVRAMREGDWEIVAGSMFGDVFRKQTADGKDWHVCDEFPIPVDWALWRGGDDGYSAPLAYYWLTQDPNTQTFYVIDELYQSGLGPVKAAERTKEKDQLIEITDQRGNLSRNLNILTGKLDSAAFSNTGTSEETITRGDQMNKLGCRWTPVEKFPGSRKARVQNFHRVLKPNDKARNEQPGIVFFKRCAHAIKTIPAIMRDDTDIEDVSDDSELHCFDGVTYGLQYKRPLGGMRRVGGL